MVLLDVRAPHIPVSAREDKEITQICTAPLAPPWASFHWDPDSPTHCCAQHSASPLMEEGSVSGHREAPDISPKPEIGPTRGCSSFSLEREPSKRGTSGRLQGGKAASSSAGAGVTEPASQGPSCP